MRLAVVGAFTPVPRSLPIVIATQHLGGRRADWWAANHPSINRSNRNMLSIILNIGIIVSGVWSCVSV
jgi:hypothetical protein